MAADSVRPHPPGGVVLHTGTAAWYDPAVSGRQFAAAVGCHPTTVSRWRNGHRLPGVALLDRIRKALGVSHDVIQIAWAAGQPAFSEFLKERVFD